MCKAGNQSISRDCFEALKKQTGRSSLSNKEARALLKELGGCACGGWVKESVEATERGFKALDAGDYITLDELEAKVG